MSESNTTPDRDKFGLLERLNHYLKGRVDAQTFLLRYRDYNHEIDDLIDIPERRSDNEFILRVLNTALDVLSHPFYTNHVAELYSVIKIIHNTYADSVKWEKSSEAWQKTIADVVRNAGNEMVIQVVRIVVREETGSENLAYEAMRDISWRAKAQSYFDHHDDKGNPV